MWSPIRRRTSRSGFHCLVNHSKLVNTFSICVHLVFVLPSFRPSINSIKFKFSKSHKSSLFSPISIRVETVNNSGACFEKTVISSAQILEKYYGFSFRPFGKKRNIFFKQKWVWHQFEYTIIKELNSSLRGSKGFPIAQKIKKLQ